MGPLLQDITVNGEVIPAAAIAAEAQMHAAPKDKPGIAWRAAGRALTVRALAQGECVAACGLVPRSLGLEHRRADLLVPARELAQVHPRLADRPDVGAGARELVHLLPEVVEHEDPAGGRDRDRSSSSCG